MCKSVAFLFHVQGYYDTMDAGIQDEEGYISVLSRTDDVINVAGHRLSCGHIEEVWEIQHTIEFSIPPSSIKQS